MQEHVQNICSRHELVVRRCNRLNQAQALHECDEIVIPAIKSPISYAVALHEIGHILGPHQHSKRQLVRERQAWQWARRNAVDWTPRMERQATASLRWYKKRD